MLAWTEIHFYQKTMKVNKFISGQLEKVFTLGYLSYLIWNNSQSAKAYKNHRLVDAQRKVFQMR